jgi:hypothetical protein
MLFHSTRGNDSGRTFEEVLMQGLANDGGLFMPDYWPQINIEHIKSLNTFIDIAKYIVPLFTKSSFSDDEVLELLDSTWHDFSKKNYAEIHQLDKSKYVLELFHGPTAAFKDFGLQLAAAFFNKSLIKQNKTAIVLGATSGDTGSVTDQVAEMRSLPAGIDQRSPARHPDWMGPDDLALKVAELRELTDNQVPIQLKLGASRVYDDVRMAAKCDPDSIFLDSMEGSTGAGPHVAAANTGIPGIGAVREARRALDDVGKSGDITLVYAGGIRDGVDMAKALALGADAIAIGTAGLIALNCNKDIPEADFEKEMGVEAGYCYHCHTGRCPVGVATQDPVLRSRLDPTEAAERVYNMLNTMTLEAQLMARACGKTNLHSLEPEDLAALTMEASAMAKVPLAGTDMTVGVKNYHSI